MPDCPKCGYALQPFERECPRCSRQAARGSREEMSDLLAAATRRTSAPARKQSQPRQLVIGAIAALVILIGLGFVYRSLRRPSVDIGSYQGTGVTETAAATPTSSGEAGGTSAAAPGTSSAYTSAPPAGAAAPPTQSAEQDLLRQCPFDLKPGKVVSAPQLEVNNMLLEGGNRGSISGDVSASGWSLRGVGGQPLQVGVAERGGPMDLQVVWQDQPFELYKNGELQGTYQSVAEYQQARGQ